MTAIPTAVPAVPVAPGDIIAALAAASLDTTKSTFSIPVDRAPGDAWQDFARDGGAFAARVAADAKALDRSRRRRLVAEAQKIVDQCVKDLIADGAAPAEAELYRQGFTRAIDTCLEANRDGFRRVITFDGIIIADYTPATNGAASSTQ